MPSKRKEGPVEPIAGIERKRSKTHSAHNASATTAKSATTNDVQRSQPKRPQEDAESSSDSNSANSSTAASSDDESTSSSDSGADSSSTADSESTSDSDSDSGSEPSSPTPVAEFPAPVAPTQSALDAFDNFYLQSVTKAFADDLEKLRQAPDFRDASLHVLVRALRQGTSCFAREERERVGRVVLGDKEVGSK